MTDEELPIRQTYLDQARAALPPPAPPKREPRRIPANAHDLGHHEHCGAECDEETYGVPS